MNDFKIWSHAENKFISVLVDKKFSIAQVNNFDRQIFEKVERISPNRKNVQYFTNYETPYNESLLNFWNSKFMFSPRPPPSVLNIMFL